MSEENIREDFHEREFSGIELFEGVSREMFGELFARGIILIMSEEPRGRGAAYQERVECQYRT